MNVTTVHMIMISGGAFTEYCRSAASPDAMSAENMMTGVLSDNAAMLTIHMNSTSANVAGPSGRSGTRRRKLNTRKEIIGISMTGMTSAACSAIVSERRIAMNTTAAISK